MLFWLNICHPRPGWKILETCRKVSNCQDSAQQSCLSHQASASGVNTTCSVLGQAPRNLLLVKSFASPERHLWTLQSSKVIENSREFCLEHFCLVQPLLPQREIQLEYMAHSSPRTGPVPSGSHVFLLLHKRTWSWGKNAFSFTVVTCLWGATKVLVQWMPFLSDVLLEQRWSWLVPLSQSCPVCVCSCIQDAAMNHLCSCRNSLHTQPTASSCLEKNRSSLEWEFQGQNRPN